jgi:2-C-methyl-D-erythritol 4-phosphate cytidylyltransferase
MGTRMNSVVPKQFLELAGQVVLMHPVNSFYSYDNSISIIVVLPADLISEWHSLCARYDFTIPHNVVEGGPKRYFSVKNALDTIPAEGLVAIHDGARPLAGQTLISRAFDSAAVEGNAIPAIPVPDSVRMITGSSNRPLDRNTLRRIQTPQVFDTAMIKKAYSTGFHDSFTDDASVLESNRVKINLIEGDPFNIKITYPEDLAIAEALIRHRCSQMR